MDTGKTAKYFKYALGEILLVVVGILIALQVSNWNKNRTNAKAEQVILIDLKTENEGNISALQNIISEHEKSRDAALKIKSLVKDSIKLKNAPMDSLAQIVIAMNYNWTYDPKLGTLNSVINSGKIDLIQNKEIRYRLSAVQEFIRDANESTQEIVMNRRTFYWPLIASKRELISVDPISFNLKEGFNNPQFLWWVRFITAVREEGLEEEQNLLNFLKELNALMEVEIDK